MFTVRLIHGHEVVEVRDVHTIEDNGLELVVVNMDAATKVSRPDIRHIDVFWKAD